MLKVTEGIMQVHALVDSAYKHSDICVSTYIIGKDEKGVPSLSYIVSTGQSDNH